MTGLARLILAVFVLLAAPDSRGAEPPPDEPQLELPEPTPAADDPYLAELEGHRADAEARSRSPLALLPLWRAFDLKDRLASLVPLQRLLGSFAERPGAPAEVRATARYLLAQVERSRGRLHKARELLARLGFIPRWHLVGPFDNEGKRGCDVAYPPEAGVDLSATFPGKAREIRWRLSPELGLDGFADLGAALKPSQETVAYAHAVVELAAEKRAVVHLGASGAVRLWVNGTRVLSDDRYHPPRPDQTGVAVTLRKGANHLLLKVCQDAGPHGFFARVAAANGEPLRGASLGAPEPIPPPAKGPRPSPEPLPTAVDQLRARAEAARDDPRARADWAEMLHRRQAFDQKEKRDAVEAAASARRAPRDAGLQLLAARLADDMNERRRFLEAALAARPSDPEATLLIARHYLARDQARRALDFAAGARERWPGRHTLALVEARALDDLGLSVRAAATVEELARRAPDRHEVVREAARLLRRQERLVDAVQLYRLALSMRTDDLESRRALASLLADLGDAAGALGELAEVARLDAWDPYAWLRLGELAAVNDRPDDARAAFARAVEIAPDDAELFEREGRALARLSDTAGAVAALSRSLELKPQNPQVKDQLRALKGEGRGFGEEWAKDLTALAADRPPRPGEDAVVLAELHATKVFPSGLAARFQQLVVRVQTTRGVESERTQWITYSPDRQELKILRARLLKPDGSILESHTDTERSLSDAASRLYYDARARLVGFPGLGLGDVLELAYRLDDTASDNLLSDYFGDVEGVQSATPKESFEYVLSAPPGRPIYWSSKLGSLGLAEEGQRNGSRLYRWTALDVPKVSPEPSMPGWAEEGAVLHVSTYRDWASVGRYYWGLVRDQLTVTDEIRDAVKEVTGGVPKGDVAATARAVYDFVVARTRYVGLEFGIHGYKPYKVDKVLARRFGDCKDKASLMHAMLKVAGIDSRLVLLRMRRLGDLPVEPASLSAFNHAILWVPSLDLWLDGTAEFHGSRELPDEDRGALVLVVDPAGASHIGHIPDGRAPDNLTRTAYEVSLKEDGRASVTGKTTVSGLAAPPYRRAYQAPATRRQTFEEGWARTFPGLSVKDLAVGDVTDLEKDVELTFSLEVPRYAQVEGGSLAFSPFGQGRTYVETNAPLSSRRHDLVLNYPWVNAFRHRFRLPGGYSPAELPEDVAVESPFGKVVLRYRVQGSDIEAEGEVSVAVSRVSTADYSAFRTFLGEIDRALGRKVRLARGK